MVSYLYAARSIFLPSRLHLRLCFLHNQVNERLKKPEFDCANLDSTYDCGCGDPPLNSKATHGANDPMDLEHDPSKDSSGNGLVKGGR